MTWSTERIASLTQEVSSLEIIGSGTGNDDFSSSS
jgi:hypothetical protein